MLRLEEYPARCTQLIKTMIISLGVRYLNNTRPLQEVCSNCSSRNSTIGIKLDLNELAKPTAQQAREASHCTVETKMYRKSYVLIRAKFFPPHIEKRIEWKQRGVQLEDPTFITYARQLNHSMF